MWTYKKDGCLFTVMTQETMSREGWSEDQVLSVFKGIRDHESLGQYLSSVDDKATVIRICDKLMFPHLEQMEIDLLPYL